MVISRHYDLTPMTVHFSKLHAQLFPHAKYLVKKGEVGYPTSMTVSHFNVFFSPAGEKFFKVNGPMGFQFVGNRLSR